MSYRGYEVVYCKNGHRIGTESYYWAEFTDKDKEKPGCPYCGCKERVVDVVNQTNGCECEFYPEEDRDPNKPCACHERELDQIGWTPWSCRSCGGAGKVSCITDWRDEPCVCNGEDLLCSHCHGTGTARVIEGEQEVDCTRCAGTGTTYVEKWDISPLIHED
jgi:hypothetical protein